MSNFNISHTMTRTEIEAALLALENVIYHYGHKKSSLAINEARKSLDDEDNLRNRTAALHGQTAQEAG